MTTTRRSHHAAPLEAAAEPTFYLQRVVLDTRESPDFSDFPLSLPFVRGLDLELTHPVTFFVGENGSGKSTLLEAIAQLCNLPVSGGGRNELATARALGAASELAPWLRPVFRRRPRDGYFFRAELQAHFATLLDERHQDPDFLGDPYARFGGRSLHTRSHGEAFLAMFETWMSPGIILMDEPEAALSPQRQLALLALMSDLVFGGQAQFIVATHSPIILTYPGASLLSFDEGSIAPIRFEDTSHYQITRGILEHPAKYWRALRGVDDT